MASMSPRDQDRFLQHKFLEQENKNFKRFGFERGIGYSLVTDGKAGFKSSNSLAGLNFHASMNPRKWFSRNEGGNQMGAAGMHFGEKLAGHGQRGHRDNDQGFRELDGPSVGRGQLAGASISDSALDGALAGGGGSGMDLMNAEQLATVRQKIERQMSGADAVNYVGMSDAEKNSFVRRYYETDPEMFAPGVGKSGTDAMFGYMKAQDEINLINKLGLDGAALDDATREPKKTIGYTQAMWEQKNAGSDINTQWGFMTRDEKAAVALAHGKLVESRDRAAENEMTAEQRSAWKNADMNKREQFSDAKYAESVLRGLVAKGTASESKLNDLIKANEALAGKLFKI